jgi:hypothetical protein
MPTRVGTESDWLEVATVAAYNRTCGLRAPGTRWCWGDDVTTPGVTFSATPVQQDLETSWTSLALGVEYDCGTRLDGSLWCGGENILGALGTGTAWYATPRAL